MSIICEKHKLLFILVPRTGSTAIARYLIENLEGKWIIDKNLKNPNGEVVVWKKHNAIPQLLEHSILTEPI